MLSWNWRTFEELQLEELYNILSLRETVFTFGQHCSEKDMDHKDQSARHLLGYQDNELKAYLRLFLAGAKYEDAVSFGRVLVHPSLRGQGIAKDMMTQTLLFLEKQQNTFPIRISAQLYLEKFYESYGFKSQGKTFLEANIPHILMLKAK